MSKRAEEFSIKYADNKLAIVDKELSETSYHRHTKMGVCIFNGSDIEQAAMDGYEQAEKDLALTPEDVQTIDNIIVDMAQHTDWPLKGKKVFYEEVLRRFIEKREKK